MEVEDAAGATTKARTQLELGPHESGSYALPLNSPSPREMGMQGEPLIPGFHLMAEDHHSVDIAHITKFRIFLVKPAGPHRLIVDSVRLVAGVTYGKIVDAFGQFALAKWPGKLESTVDFASQRRKEEAELKVHPNLPGRDEYGGWASGPQLEATGYFRTARRNGKWWLVTPNGHLFFSFGIDSVNTTGGSTVVEGREYMFKWLPAPGDPLSSHYGSSHYDSPVGPEIEVAQGRTFNFYRANLARKYGRDWKELWKSITLARLRAWGFNTIGNWSDPQLYDARRVPYTATLHVDGDFAEVRSASDYWKPMADPFDPAFAEAVDRAARESAQHLDDPWCIGYFVDNELPWGTMANERDRSGLALGTLSLRAGSPAKRAFVDQLRHRYATIQDLNSAWGSHISDWQTLLDEPFKPEGDFNQAIREHMHAFCFVQTMGRQIVRRLQRHGGSNFLNNPSSAKMPINPPKTSVMSRPSTRDRDRKHCHACCGLAGPAELSPVNPITANRARQGHDRLLHSAAPGDLHGPGLKPGPFLRMQHALLRFVEHHPHHLIPAARYPAAPVDLA
jgi:hypothetical protein